MWQLTGAIITISIATTRPHMFCVFCLCVYVLVSGARGGSTATSLTREQLHGRMGQR